MSFAWARQPNPELNTTVHWTSKSTARVWSCFPPRGSYTATQQKTIRRVLDSEHPSKVICVPLLCSSGSLRFVWPFCVIAQGCFLSFCDLNLFLNVICCWITVWLFSGWLELCYSWAGCMSFGPGTKSRLTFMKKITLLHGCSETEHVSVCICMLKWDPCFCPLWYPRCSWTCCAFTLVQISRHLVCWCSSCWSLQLKFWTETETETFVHLSWVSQGRTKWADKPMTCKKKHHNFEESCHAKCLQKAARCISDILAGPKTMIGKEMRFVLTWFTFTKTLDNRRQQSERRWNQMPFAPI